jgi:hypothetical protein
LDVGDREDTEVEEGDADLGDKDFGGVDRLADVQVLGNVRRHHLQANGITNHEKDRNISWAEHPCISS